MLHRLNLLPLLVIPALTVTFVLREQIIELPWFKETRTEENLPPLERFQLKSKNTGVSYQIQVQVPHFYADSNQRYPVFYTIGVPPQGSVYSEVVLPLILRGDIPEPIIVSIAMPQPPNLLVRLSAARRNIRPPGRTWLDDLTFHPDPDHPDEGGKAEQFVAFLETELIPEINARYRAARGDAGIGGMDLGGLFAVEVSYRRPGLFNRAIAIAPRVNHADFAIIDDLRTMDPPRARRRDATRLYIGVGEAEFDAKLAEFEMLRDVIRRMPPNSVEVKSEVIRGRSRQTQAVPAAQSGLKFVYGE